MKEKTIESSGNVFQDFGFEKSEAVNLKLRSQLMMLLEAWISENKLTQYAAADQLDVTQSRVSDLVCGKIDRFSLDMLVTMLEKTGRQVSIHVDDKVA